VPRGLSRRSSGSRAYRRGYLFELLVRDELAGMGLVVYRVARSSGRPRSPQAAYPPVDLIAFLPDGRALFVECKLQEPSRAQLERMREAARALPGFYFVVTRGNLESFLEEVRGLVASVSNKNATGAGQAG